MVATNDCRLKAAFKPEFLNRLDEIVLFQSLRKQNIEPLKRAIQQHVENELAKRLIAGEIPQGTDVAVDVAEGGEKLAMVASRGHRTS